MTSERTAATVASPPGAAAVRDSGRFDFLVVAVPYAVICLNYLWYIPIWDSGVYLNCLLAPLRAPHHLSSLNCVNHPTCGYFALLELPFWLSGRHYGAVIVVNVVLGVLGLHAVADLSRLVAPAPDRRAERALVTAAVALAPLFVASTVQLTPDFGVAVFSLCTLRALARERFVVAALFGLLASLSKETGAPIYVLFCALQTVAFGVWAPDFRSTWRTHLRRRLPLLLTPLAWFGVASVRMMLRRPDQGLAWRGVGSDVPLWRHALSVTWIDNILPTQLAELFVINFAWVMSAFVLLAAVRPAVAWARCWLLREPPPPLGTPDQRMMDFLTMSFVATVIVVTRFRTWVFPRYVLPAFVLLPLVTQRSFESLAIPRRSRLLILGLVGVLSFGSIFRTRDGLSLALFPPFEFGSHRILDLASWTGEVGHRDHMVYNLEFTHVHRLLNQVLPVVVDHRSHAFATHVHSSWYAMERVDPRSRQRVTFQPGASRPCLWVISMIRESAKRPKQVYYLEFPGIEEDMGQLPEWNRYYERVGTRRFTEDGYALLVHDLRLRADAPPAVSR